MRLHIDGIWIRNYRVHKLIGFGACFPRITFIDEGDDYAPFELGSLTAFAGKNGTGKNSVFDAIQFLSDVLHYNVERACLKRGGFHAIHTLGAPGPTTIGLDCHIQGTSDAYTYAISIQNAKNGQPFIETEILASKGEPPVPILLLQNHPKVIRHIAASQQLERTDLNAIEFCDYRNLGLGAILAHPTFPIIAAIRQMLECLYICDFSLDIGRGCSPAVSIKPPNPRGTTLATLLKYYAERYTDRFLDLINRAGQSVTGVQQVHVTSFRDNIPQICFMLRDMEGTIPLGQMSAAALRMFTYGLLAIDPFPPPLMIFVHPENTLDQTNCLHFSHVLESLITTASRGAAIPQMFLSTNNSTLLGGLKPEHIWITSLDNKHYAMTERACDTYDFREALNAGLEITTSWFHDCFAETL